jgi:hypothetical protein
MNRSYDRLTKDMNNLIDTRAGQLTLVSDGWSNGRSESFINYLLVSRTEAIFLKSVATGKDRHTGLYIAEGLKEVIEEVGREKIVAVTTDNASNMRSALAEVKKEWPDLFTMGCSAHMTNLLVEDLCKMDEISGVLGQVKDVVRYFKTSAILLGVLDSTAMEMGAKRTALQLPGNTRWQGKLLCVRSIEENKSILQRAILNEGDCLPERPTREQRTKYSDMRSLILDEGFFGKVAILRKFLEPFLKVTLALESDKPKLSRLYGYYTWLSEVQVTGLVDAEVVQEKIIARFAKIYHPLLVIAYLCDPCARQERPVAIRDEDMASTGEWLSHHYAAVEPSVRVTVWRQLLQLKEREGRFKSEMNWEAAQEIEAITWWKSLHQSACPALSELATYALSINPTTGAAERNWSAHSHIHTKNRNRLNNSRISKLVFLYWNLRIRAKVSADHDLSSLTDEEVSEADSDAGKDHEEVSEEEGLYDTDREEVHEH